MLERFFKANRRASARLARYVNSRTGRIDGAKAYHEVVHRTFLRPGLDVLDVGGGKQPVVSAERRRALELHVTGLDISERELARAPEGCYDDRIVGDVTGARLPRCYDLILSRSVLEHLVEPAAALRNMACALKPGGTMVHLLPCRYAPYALTNRVLGRRVGRKLLHALFPDVRRTQGFPAYYRHCSPSAMVRIGKSLELDPVRLDPYYCSDYTSFFLPLYAVDLLRQVLLLRIRATNLCENFLIALRSRT